MKKNKIIYLITNEDVQYVANEELERILMPSEIEAIKEAIADKINWYDAIAEAISEKIKIVSIP